MRERIDAVACPHACDRIEHPVGSDDHPRDATADVDAADQRPWRYNGGSGNIG